MFIGCVTDRLKCSVGQSKPPAAMDVSSKSFSPNGNWMRDRNFRGPNNYMYIYIYIYIYIYALDMHKCMRIR